MPTVPPSGLGKPGTPPDDSNIGPVTPPRPHGGPNLSETEGSYEPHPAPGAAPGPIPQPVPVGTAPDRPTPALSVTGPLDFLGSVLTGALGSVGLILRPEAALAVASEFTFPMALALAVLLFLVVQDQIDRRDPKLRTAPQRQTDTFIRFEPEEQP